MMYATAGNLDTFLLARSHSIQPSTSAHDIGDSESLGQLPRAERIKAFKKRRASGIGRQEENRGVLMLGVNEVLSLFGDIVEGLAFLVSILFAVANLLLTRRSIAARLSTSI
jgi:hypothetical protein